MFNIFNISSKDFLEDLFPNQPSGNPTFLPHPVLTSPEVNNDIFDSEGCNVQSEKLLDLDSTIDLYPHPHDNLLSGSTTYFSNSLLKEFADELPSEYDDNLQFDIESDLKEIEFLLYQDKDSSLKDSIDQKNHANLADLFVDYIPEMFTDEHTRDYSSPPIFDVYDDDFLEVESDAGNVYDDPFDSKGEKIKESKILIDELDLPCDFLHPSEYDSFISQDFSKVDALPSTNNEDKVFNPVESDAGNVYDDPFDSKGEKIKESKILIDELNLPCDLLPPFEYDSFISQDFSKVDALPSTNNEDKVFNPGYCCGNLFSSIVWFCLSSILRNVKTLAKGFCTKVFISSASIGNHPSGYPTFLPHPELTSSEVNNDIFDSEGCNVLSEKLLDLDSTIDLYPPPHDNLLSGSTTYFLTHCLRSSPMSFLRIEFDAGNIYDDPLDSKGEKIKESKILIDELDLPCDLLPPFEYDSFISQDFSKVDAFPSTNNEDKVFNPGILIQEKPVKIITVVQDKKLFDPPFYEPLFFKEVPKSKMLLPFSSENEEKVFKPWILTSEKVHSHFIPELSHQGSKVFKINHIFKSLMKIFLFYCGKDTHILAVPHHHFYPP
uniref:Reverse transcriptase domain-containing protein n=1 Tax=Tanacetum cinerariifolium TaxID=118510 RepID=A0A6L2L170_TANCI|nr:hypothetical protein [Tanacetum cinerariifolium]